MASRRLSERCKAEIEPRAAMGLRRKPSLKAKIERALQWCEQAKVGDLVNIDYIAEQIDSLAAEFDKLQEEEARLTAFYDLVSQCCSAQRPGHIQGEPEGTYDRFQLVKDKNLQRLLQQLHRDLEQGEQHRQGNAVIYRPRANSQSWQMLDKMLRGHAKSRVALEESLVENNKKYTFWLPTRGLDYYEFTVQPL